MTGIIERYTHWLHTQWPAGTVEKLPVSGEDGATRAGAVRAILREPEFSRKGECGTMKDGEGIFDLVIVGAGVAGVSAAIEAKKAGLRFVVFEATQIFSTVVNFPKQKPIYTYPTEMKLDGGLQFSADVKEALVEEMEQQRKAAGIEVTAAHIERIERKGSELLLHRNDKKVTRARRVIVAIGRSGNFRKLGVHGEDLDKVYNRLYDPKEFAGKQALVLGGGDTAMETAIALTSC